MKITKVNKKLDEQLIEKLVEDVLPESEEDLSDINPQNDSVDEIADALQNSVELDSDGEQTISDTDAQKTAAEMKDIADDINAKDVAVLANNESALASVNILTAVLDKCLAVTSKSVRQGRKANFNLLVDGLPGSGKTAIFDSWARQHGLNVTSLNASDPDLELVINGMILRDNTKPEDNKIAKAYSTTLESLERPNSVLFLDEFNRADPTMRRSLLTLINEKSIIVAADKDAEPGSPASMGRKVFDNLLFTVACINPPVRTDKGATKLNDAEKSRFWRAKKFDSDTETAMDYFNKKYTKLIINLNPEDANYMQDLEDYLRSENLALYIVNHPMFSFDTRDDLEDLNDYDATMLNQRELTIAIDGCDGNVENLLDWLEDSNLLEKDIQMLKDILNTYPVPTLQDLINNKQYDLEQLGVTGVSLPGADAITAAETANDNAAATEDSNKEDDLEDDDLFNKSSTGKVAITPADAEQRIKDFMAQL